MAWGSTPLTPHSELLSGLTTGRLLLPTGGSRPSLIVPGDALASGNLSHLKTCPSSAYLARLSNVYVCDKRLFPGS